jgi:hypothetical protein
VTAHVHSINPYFYEDAPIRRLRFPDNYRRTIVEEYRKGKQIVRKHNPERLEFSVRIVLER